MRRTIPILIFCAITLFSASSFAKPEIITAKNTVEIKSGQNLYSYDINNQQSDFFIFFKYQNNEAFALIVLNKNDVPKDIFIISSEDHTCPLNHLPKSDPKNRELYNDLEQHIRSFVNNNGVKKILKKYK